MCLSRHVDFSISGGRPMGLGWALNKPGKQDLPYTLAECSLL